MMDQEVVKAALAKEAQVGAVGVHIYVHYGRRLSWCSHVLVIKN